MRWSPEKLRWLSLGGALLLAGVLAALFGLARYSKGKIWQRILARNGVNLVQESKSITWSQSVGGRTVFTVHAAKSVPHGNGQWTLHDAVLILYGKDGRNDRIRGSAFEYDEKAGVLRAVGEVHMDLEAPQAAGGNPKPGAKPDLSFAEDETAEDPALIHVRTSGLVYMRKLGVAATKEMAEFKYQGLTCTSQGAEFDSGPNVLRLLAEVHMSGTLRKAPFTLTAARANLDRSVDSAELTEPRVESRGRSARARHAVLHLHRDGSLESSEADGDVELLSGTQKVSAPQLRAEFGVQNRVSHAVLSGGVTFADSSSVRLENGSAESVDLTTTAAGALSNAVATGGVAFLVKEIAASGPPATRRIHAQQATASFVPEAGNSKRSVLRALHMTGAAEFEAESVAKAHGQQATMTRVSADDLTTTFSPEDVRRPEPQRTVGAGHTTLQQMGVDGQHQVSTGDALDVSFATRQGTGRAGSGAAVEVSRAVQTGHIVLHSWPAAKPGPSSTASGTSTGYAQQAVFEAAEGTLTLNGVGGLRAEVDDGGTQIRAPRIVLHQGTGDGEATGGVTATTDGANGGPATHVLAGRAALFHSADVSEFDGTDAQPAQLWQAGSQVRAARIVLDGQHHTLSARPQGASGVVNAVFASARGVGESGHAAAGARTGSGAVPTPRNKVPAAEVFEPAGSTMPEASRDTVQVRAAGMDYSDVQHEATFKGGVLMRDPAGEVTGARAAAFLQAPSTKAGAAASPAGEARGQPSMGNLGGRLDRLVVVGDVRVTEPGRTGKGEQITYTAASNNFVLTGTPADPPRVRDVQQGTVTGTTLVFGASDSSIVVAGAHASGEESKPTRVHTETDIRQH